MTGRDIKSCALQSQINNPRNVFSLGPQHRGTAHTHLNLGPGKICGLRFLKDNVEGVIAFRDHWVGKARNCPYVLKMNNW